MFAILYNKVSFINIFFPLSTTDVAVESVIVDSLLAHIGYIYYFAFGWPMDAALYDFYALSEQD